MYHCFNALLNRSENNFSSDHTNAALKFKKFVNVLWLEMS